MYSCPHSIQYIKWWIFLSSIYISLNDVIITSHCCILLIDQCHAAGLSKLLAGFMGLNIVGALVQGLISILNKRKAWDRGLTLPVKTFYWKCKVRDSNLVYCVYNRFCLRRPEAPQDQNNRENVARLSCKSLELKSPKGKIMELSRQESPPYVGMGTSSNNKHWHPKATLSTETTSLIVEYRLDMD